MTPLQRAVTTLAEAQALDPDEVRLADASETTTRLLAEARTIASEDADRTGSRSTRALVQALDRKLAERLRND